MLQNVVLQTHEVVLIFKKCIIIIYLKQNYEPCILHTGMSLNICLLLHSFIYAIFRAKISDDIYWFPLNKC